jgi:fructosamine-3-kinase
MITGITAPSPVSGLASRRGTFAGGGGGGGGVGRGPLSRVAISVRRSPSSLRVAAGARAEPGSVREWIERNLDAGAVTDVSRGGSSGWAEFSTYTTESGKRFFVKTSRRDPSMFIGEGAGLNAMFETNTLAIPRVYYAGATPEGSREGNSFIVMDHLNFGGRGDQAEFGRQLALMHAATPAVEEARAGKFGFTVDNTCGDTPQPNGWMDDWVQFYLERRIRHQLRLARDSTLTELGEKVCERAPLWFEPCGAIKPSILHGDLWSGNIGTVDGKPSVFDPAVYYGHSEAEFGMSWCAGFSQKFYDAYFEVLPKVETHFEERRQLYLLYHYLNHYNLFGGGYRGQCVGIMKGLLA